MTCIRMKRAREKEMMDSRTWKRRGLFRFGKSCGTIVSGDTLFVTASAVFAVRLANKTLLIKSGFCR